MDTTQHHTLDSTSPGQEPTTTPAPGVPTQDDLPLIDRLDAGERMVRDEVLMAAHHHPLTDAGNAEVFTYVFQDKVRYDHARGRWLVWNGNYWKPDADAEVERMALRAVRLRHTAAAQDDLSYEEAKELSTFALRSESKSRLDAMLALARTMKPIADAGEGWDEMPGLIGCENGVVDLRTGQLRPGKPEDKITMTTGLEYDPHAVCPRWDRFVVEVTEPEVAALLQKLAGAALSGEDALDQLIFFMGAGSNGKDTYAETLDSAFGDYASTISSQAFSDARRNAHSTEMRDLMGVRFAYSAEIGSEKLNTERLKALSGTRDHRARGMRENTVQFRRTWLLHFTTNGLPQSDDNSWGWWRRVVAVDFPHTFTGKEDPDLEETLKRELPGILVWAVRGAVEWYANGLGELPEAVVEKTAQYREDLDPLAVLFADGYLERCPEEVWTPTANLAYAYRLYANSKGWPAEKQWSETYLGTLLGSQFPRKRVNKVPLADGTTQRMTGYLGVKLGPNSPVSGGSSWLVLEDGSVETWA